MQHNKRTAEGRRERLSLLRPTARQSLYRSGPCAHGAWPEPRGLDDVLDACALAIVADRRRRGLARCLPAGEPPRDAKGLRMEIWCG